MYGCAQPVLRSGGAVYLPYEATLEQFAGDSVMAILNDPMPCTAHTATAVRMAVEIRERMTALSHDWRLRVFESTPASALPRVMRPWVASALKDASTIARRDGLDLVSRFCSKALGCQYSSHPAHATVTDLVEVEPVNPLELRASRPPCRRTT